MRSTRGTKERRPLELLVTQAFAWSHPTIGFPSAGALRVRVSWASGHVQSIADTCVLAQVCS